MKEILVRKSKFSDYETMTPTEECDAILQKKLSQKLKDSGSFNIPCTIKSAFFNKALCDLGASINLMSLSIFKKFRVGEARTTTVTLELADRLLTRYDWDVLVRVDKFIFPVHFLILDIEKDKYIPIIHGRPFLATWKALIDVQKGEFKPRVQEEEMKFNVFNAMKFPIASNYYFSYWSWDAIVSNGVGYSDPSEATMIQIGSLAICDEEVEGCIMWMKSFEPYKKKHFETLG